MFAQQRKAQRAERRARAELREREGVGCLRHGRGGRGRRRCRRGSRGRAARINPCAGAGGRGGGSGPGRGGRGRWGGRGCRHRRSARGGRSRRLRRGCRPGRRRWGRGAGDGVDEQRLHGVLRGRQRVALRIPQAGKGGQFRCKAARAVVGDGDLRLIDRGVERDRIARRRAGPALLGDAVGVNAGDRTGCGGLRLAAGTGGLGGGGFRRGRGGGRPGAAAGLLRLRFRPRVFGCGGV